MLMTCTYTILLAISIIAAAIQGTGSALTGAMLEGAQKGITLTISMAGSLCLWCGIQALMEKIGLLDVLRRLTQMPLSRIFPSIRKNPALGEAISGNFCANLMGLGNAATPLGIRAARELAQGCHGWANDELCRLIVLNTASIQLIPTNVAALRASLGCERPFDILLPVWITSLCAASLGLCLAKILEKVWPDA